MSLFRSIWRGQGGGSTGGGSASDITFNPAGLKVLKGTNVQSALNETDNALADLQDSVSILATSVPLANTIGADTVIMLDELTALEIDGRPNYKLPGATVFAPNGQQGIIHSVDSDNQSATVKTTVLSVSGGGTNAGIKGDYFATWGWTEGDNGLPTIVSGSNNIKIPAGIVMMCPGADGYITFTGEMVYENELTEDFTLFYARNTDGTGATHVGATDVVWSDTEPKPNGQSGFQAWKKSGNSNWQLRSNDTGNTWREVVGGPIADVHYTDGNVTRLDFDGYRQFNKQEYLKNGSSIKLKQPSNYILGFGRAGDIFKGLSSSYADNLCLGVQKSSSFQVWFTFDDTNILPGLGSGWIYSLGNINVGFIKIYTQKLNNGADIAIPTTGGTMALVEDITPIKDHSVIEFQAPTADNNYTWYRKYKDGWIEQGGAETLTGVQEKQITFPVIMRDGNYTPTVTGAWSSASGPQMEGAENRQTTGMRLTSSYQGVTLFWSVKGLAA